VVLREGDIIGPAEVGLLATVGVIYVPVYKLPVVAVLSTGDELVEPDEVPGPGQIRDSNRSMLIALINSLHIPVIDLGIAGDTREELENQIKEGFKSADILVSSGGVSMGELDLLKPILEESGTLHFGKVLMKPGQPFTFATFMFEEKEKLVFALPGNPVSSLVTFQMFGIPSIRKMCGYKNFHLPKINVKVQQRLKMDPQRPEFHRAIVKWDNSLGCFVAESTGKQISSRLLSMKTANALLCLPQEEGFVESGSIVDAILIGSITN